MGPREMAAKTSGKSHGWKKKKILGVAIPITNFWYEKERLFLKFTVLLLACEFLEPWFFFKPGKGRNKSLLHDSKQEAPLSSSGIDLIVAN